MQDLVIRGKSGIVDTQIFDFDQFRHITGVAEIVQAGIGSADNAGICGFTAGGHENAVADQEFTLPCAAVIGTQVDKIPAINGGVLHGKGTSANGVYSLVTQSGVADGCIGDAHVSIESG